MNYGRLLGGGLIHLNARSYSRASANITMAVADTAAT